MIDDIANLQKKYEKLLETGYVTKKDLCDLVIPFRNKYKLTDIQALKITRNEVSIEQMIDWCKEVE